jgi:hypothetical protein
MKPLKLESFQDTLIDCIKRIRNVIDVEMKDEGLKEENSQKITVLNRLKELEYAINGVDQGDLTEYKGGKYTGYMDKNGFNIRLNQKVRRTGTFESYSKPTDTFLVYESNGVVCVDGIELRHYAPKGSLYTTLEIV